MTPVLRHGERVESHLDKQRRHRYGVLYKALVERATIPDLMFLREQRHILIIQSYFLVSYETKDQTELFFKPPDPILLAFIERNG